MTAFRQRLCEKMEITPFVHQAEWWLASDGLTLLDEVVGEDVQDSYLVQLPDGETQRRRVQSRLGGGIRAHVLADLGAFKVGKSFGAGVWAAGFGAIPEGRISLVGAEYDMCSPEFEYICDCLLSERGMNLKYDSLQNRPRDGRMYLDLKNGCRFEAKSWERKDSLKGKEIDVYIYCEAYQLPGLECYTTVKQNLVARDGYALFPTTPDRPWLKDIHVRAHSGEEQYRKWHCTCSVPRSVNRFTFSQEDQDQANPNKGGLMTREKYAIAYEGKLGEFVGRVYNFQRGENIFTPSTHPELFRNGVLSLPEGWKAECAVDTGTFMGGVITFNSPTGTIFVVHQLPNYHYINQETELDQQTSVPQWATAVAAFMGRYGIRVAWADKNSQFKRELLNYSISLAPATIRLEARTEILRTYFQSHSIWLSPEVSEGVLGQEIENAQWPEEATAGGKFERIKKNDHTLDCLEHLAARHPKGDGVPLTGPVSWAEQTFGARFGQRGKGNSHLGTQ